MLFRSKIEKLMKKAELGDSVAQNRLGELFELGKGVKKDMEKALYWYEASQKQNNLDAYFNLGVYYGAIGNFVLAEKYLNYAADRGHTKAKITLKFMP